MSATGKISLLKITSEGAVAAGVRRIEAITADAVEEFLESNEQLLGHIKAALKNPKDVLQSLTLLLEENKSLKSQLSDYQSKEIAAIKQSLMAGVKNVDGIHYVISDLGIVDEKDAKTLSFQLEKELGNAYILFGLISNHKPMLMLHISAELVKSKSMNAVMIIKDLAAHIQGGGGGQPFYATAGGKKADGIQAALNEAKSKLVQTKSQVQVA